MDIYIICSDELVISAPLAVCSSQEEAYNEANEMINRRMTFLNLAFYTRRETISTTEQGINVHLLNSHEVYSKLHIYKMTVNS